MKSFVYVYLCTYCRKSWLYIVYIRTCIHIHRYMCKHAYECTFVCVGIYVCMYTYIYAHIHKPFQTCCLVAELSCPCAHVRCLMNLRLTRTWQVMKMRNLSWSNGFLRLAAVACMYVCMHVCMYVLCVCVCVLSVCVCLYVCMYVCVYIYNIYVMTMLESGSECIL
jgi:hypothetical protein